MSALSCLLVDDHPLVRVGPARVIKEAGFAPVLEADSVVDALALMFDPHVVVLDLKYDGDDPVRMGLQGSDAVAAVARRWPSAAILVWSGYKCSNCAVSAMAAGASGYLSKDADANTLLSAVKAVAAGEEYMTPRLARLIEQTEQTAGKPFDLTDRHLEVLKLVARGLTQQQIANRLLKDDGTPIVLDTVKDHLREIRARMQCTSNMAAVRKAAEAGIIRDFTPRDLVTCACWRREGVRAPSLD